MRWRLPFSHFLTLIPFIFSLSLASSAQTPLQSGVRLARLKLNLISSFIYSVYQGQLDMDSASWLTARKEYMDHALLYNELYDDGVAFPGEKEIAVGQVFQARNKLNEAVGSNRVKLFLALGAYYLYKPGDAPKDMDSAFYLLSSAKTLSEKLQFQQWSNPAMIMLARYYAKSGDFRSSQTLFSYVIGGNQRKGDLAGLAQAYAEKGTYSAFGDTSKMNDLGRAYRIFVQMKDTIKQIEMLTRALEQHFLLAQFDTVTAGLLKVVNLEDALGLQVLHYDYNVLAYMASAEGNQRDQFRYCNEAIRHMDAAKDYAFQDFFYIMMGSLFDHLGDPTEASIWLEKSLDTLSPTRNERLWYNSFLAEVQLLARFYRSKQALALIERITREFPPVNKLDKVVLSGVKGWSYHLLNEPDSARTYFGHFLSLSEEMKSEPRSALSIADLYSKAALFYINSGDLNNGVEIFRKIDALKVKGNLEIDAYMEQIRYKIDSSRGDFKAALKDFYLSKTLDDSLNDNRGKTQLEELRIKYELDKRDKDIQLKGKNIQLLTNETKLQESRARQASVIRDVMIGGSLILLLLLGLLYRQYAVKKTKNLQLEVQQSEISAKNEALVKLLRENDWLLREVHHRVKNNLQIVMSLLNSQTSYLHDEAALKAVMESQHRVQTMSLIHQKLYKSKNVSTVYMPEYISDLVSYLRDSFKTGNLIRFHVDVEAIDLDVMHAVPVGLILNEVITNAIKYAFPANTDPAITIRFTKVAADQILLIISDNGSGFPLDFNLEGNGSFGIILIKGLAEDLDGTLDIKSVPGVSVSVQFSTAPAKRLAAEVG